MHGTCINHGVDAEMIQKLSNWLCEHSQNDDFELVWLVSSKKSALENYSDKNCGQLEKWNFANDPDFKIISDLGSKGQLIAYTESKINVDDLN